MPTQAEFNALVWRVQQLEAAMATVSYQINDAAAEQEAIEPTPHVNLTEMDIEPQPRSWPTLDAVPDGVVVRDNQGDSWQYLKSQGGWMFWTPGGGTAHMSYNAPSDYDHYAPFTEII